MAFSDIKATAERLGARLKRVAAAEWAGPCPKCGGTDRFSVNVKLGVWICRGCVVGGDAIDLARHVAGFSFREAKAWLGLADEREPAGRWRSPPPKPAPALRAAPEREADDAARRAAARAIWQRASDPRGTIAETYLRSRGLDLDADLAGDVLRFDRDAGAMVALFRSIATGEPCAVSRTFLDREARKIERKFLGLVGGSAIMLDPFDAVTAGLHIAEGIETALTARRFGYRPVWALGSSGEVKKFPALSGIECLTLFEEDDDNNASQNACAACEGQWLASGKEVIIRVPIFGKDINDPIRGAA